MALDAPLLMQALCVNIMIQKIQTNELVYVHSMPEWLLPYLEDSNSEYHVWAKDYERLTRGRTLWRVWMIDEFSDYWLEVNYINDKGLPEFHTIKLEPNTFVLVETEPYEIITETHA